MTKKQIATLKKKLALDLLVAITGVLNENGINSKYYEEYMGQWCDSQGDDIVNQELEAAE